MLSFIRHLADISADVINPLFASPDLRIEWKEDATPVTYADRKAEQVMREAIAREFPDHGIIGEEFPNTDEGAEFTWVLDPIDGTRAYAAGCPLFGTLICLSRRGQPIWGAIHLPLLQRLYIGDNTTCWANDRVIGAPAPPQLKDCTLLTTDPKNPPQLQSASGWNDLLGATGQFRSWGDCFGYTLLLGGGAHIMTDPILNLWDVAALLPVLRGAGLMASAWDGGDPLERLNLIAAHPDIHSQVIALLNPAGQ